MKQDGSFDFGPLVGIGLLIYIDLRTWSMLVKYLHVPVILAGVLALVLTGLLGYGVRQALRAAAAADEQPRAVDTRPTAPSSRPKGALPPLPPHRQPTTAAPSRPQSQPRDCP